MKRLSIKCYLGIWYWQVHFILALKENKKMKLKGTKRHLLCKWHWKIKQDLLKVSEFEKRQVFLFFWGGKVTSPQLTLYEDAAVCTVTAILFSFWLHHWNVITFISQHLSREDCFICLKVIFKSESAVNHLTNLQTS